MRRSKPQSLSDVAGANRLVQLAAAFAACRRVHGPGRRIPLGLRRQVLAALDAGVSGGAIERACGVSWSQTRYWRSAAHAGGPVMTAPQVLSVVDRQAAPAFSPSPDGGLELRYPFGDPRLVGEGWLRAGSGHAEADLPGS
jgi:hypothetical protein